MFCLILSWAANCNSYFFSTTVQCTHFQAKMSIRVHRLPQQNNKLRDHLVSFRTKRERQSRLETGVHPSAAVADSVHSRTTHSLTLPLTPPGNFTGTS